MVNQLDIYGTIKIRQQRELTPTDLVMSFEGDPTLGPDGCDKLNRLKPQVTKLDKLLTHDKVEFGIGLDLCKRNFQMKLTFILVCWSAGLCEKMRECIIVQDAWRSEFVPRGTLCVLHLFTLPLPVLPKSLLAAIEEGMVEQILALSTP